MGGPAKFRMGLYDFGVEGPVPAPDELLDLLFEKVPGGRGGYNRWTINGKSWPAANPLFTCVYRKLHPCDLATESPTVSEPCSLCSTSC
jgi:hypothetical protein